MSSGGSTWRTSTVLAVAAACTAAGPGGAAWGQGGTPCSAVPGNCCAGRPSFDDPAYAGFSGLVTVGTASPAALGAAVVNVFNVVNPNAGPFDTDFGAPVYTHPSWSESNLGSVFGVTLDADGNIYVTAASCYFLDSAGALGGIGDVYVLDTDTAAASVFATLPNTGPALGNITYDCGHDQFFVSNMDDGMIYRLDAAGSTLNAFDFGAPDDPTEVFAPLGDRVWAVAVHDGRLYFSVWREDNCNPSTVEANEIWSIGLDGLGDFSGAAVLELQVPPNAGADYSNPVSDMRFTPTGSLLIAERGMCGPTTPTAHDARLLEFVCENGAWTLGPATFMVGTANGENTAGGVDIDYDAGGRVYATGDALQFNPQTIYGIQGLPATGGSPADSIFLDYNGNLVDQDKNQIGDVAVVCGACASVSGEHILCEIGPAGPTGCYQYTFDLTNSSGATVQYLLIPHPDVTPHVIPVGPLAHGATAAVTVQICNQPPGSDFCFDIILADAQVEACCAIEQCVELPDCTCFQFKEETFTCIEGPTPEFSYGFVLTNLTANTIEHLFLIPPAGAPFTVAPDYIDVPALPPFGVTAPIKVILTFSVAPMPGTAWCFNISIHAADLHECCAEEACVAIPDCPQPTCPGDLDHDGAVGIVDFLAILGSWGTGDPGCDIAPSGGDGSVDVVDMLLLLSTWGPCG